MSAEVVGLSLGVLVLLTGVSGVSTLVDRRPHPHRLRHLLIVMGILILVCLCSLAFD